MGIRFQMAELTSINISESRLGSPDTLAAPPGSLGQPKAEPLAGCPSNLLQDVLADFSHGFSPTGWSLGPWPCRTSGRLTRALAVSDERPFDSESPPIQKVQ